jgi:eukaryotic-like serine/threonine-protein kinase
MAIDAARAKSLFLVASEVAEPTERAALLECECGGNSELRARVEALLRANEGAPLLSAAGAVVDPANGRAETKCFSDRTARVGVILAGKYKLVEEIGAGGMGSVFMALQTEPVKRAVAVKVIKAGMDSRAVLARFEAERQALAMMDHPNIAKVLDAGTTEGGRSFFVMELVKGTPITRYCDEHRLTPRQRLELFVPVCQAIQHAHQKGVIHRDIKPSNVLVALYDDQPVPKVIDFGVAKAAGVSLTDKTLMTGFGAVIGTPEYMSPEQASLNNLDIDTRSDVYSLGVLLYELLTGTTPVDKKSLGHTADLEILRIVREVEARRPSARLSTIDTLPSVAASRGTEPAKLSKLLKGELDWVVMKALEKDRRRRYETANGLARDIQRYLADEVVEARPPSVSYRVSKFVRRHKGQVMAASLVLLALVGGIVGTTLGLFEARRQEDKARQSQGETASALAVVESQKKVVESQKKEVEGSLFKAETAERLARAAEEAARKLLYTTDMQLAPFVWRDDRTSAEQLRVLLEKHIPDSKAATEKPDLRGFEWYYYQNLLEHSSAVLSGHAAPVVDGALTPDGQLVTLDELGQVRRWDLDTQFENAANRRDLPGGRSAKVQVLSPSGRLAALADENKVHVFDTATGQEKFQIDSANNRRLIFSRDNDWLVIVDDKIRWLSAAGEVIAAENPGFNGVKSLALSADGLTLAAVGHGSSSKQFSIFHLDATKRKVTPPANGAFSAPFTLNAAALSPDGRRIAVSTVVTGRLYIYDTATGRQIAQHLSAHASPISALAFAGDGVKLATADRQGTIKIWADARNLNSKSTALLTLKGHYGAITTAGFSGDGKRLITTSADKTARVWNLENAGATIRPLEGSDFSRVVRSSPDGLLIAVAAGNSVRLWDGATGRLVRELPLGAGTGSIHSVAFSPTDNHLLAVGYGGGQPDESYVALWDIDAGTELARLPGAADLPELDANARAVGALAFSPDGKYLVAGFGSKTYWSGNTSATPLNVWEIGTRRLIRRLGGHTNYCVSLDFSRDGRLLASGSRDGTAILWSTATWQATLTLLNPAKNSSGGRGLIEDVAFSPDGKTLAMASREEGGKVLLWNVAAGKLVATLKGHSTAVQAVAFSPDGRTLASGSGDQTVRLWNVETRRELMQLDPGDIELGEVFTLSFSPDGKRLLAGGRGPAVLWSATPIVWNNPKRTTEELHRIRAGETADSYAAEKDWERAIAAYRQLLVDEPRNIVLLNKLITTYKSANRTREAVPYLAKLSIANPKNTELWIDLAACQAWFGQDQELAATRQRILALAKDTGDMLTAERAAKVCSIVASTDKAEQEAGLALAHKAVELGKRDGWNLLALGIAEYRGGHDAAAAEALLAAAAETGPNSYVVRGTAAFYRAMSVYRAGKPDEARRIAIEAVAKMKPLPNPSLDNPYLRDDLVLWLAYKEAKTMIKFDEAPPPEAKGNQN